MKVIQHNVEQKTALYVYYLYKNLENESQILTKKVLADPNVILEDKDLLTETKRDKAMQKVLQNIDAKKYCELFANDINVTGKVNCEENIKNEQQAMIVKEAILLLLIMMVSIMRYLIRLII